MVPQFGKERPALLTKKSRPASAKSNSGGDAGGEGGEDATATEGEGEEGEFEHRNGVMDFGNLRVFESSTKTFTLSNSGDYDIRFSFAIKRRATAKLFTVSPMEGLLPAGGEEGGGTEITVTFLSSTEVSLKNNKDIRCEIFEPLTEELFEVGLKAWASGKRGVVQ